MGKKNRTVQSHTVRVKVESQSSGESDDGKLATFYCYVHRTSVLAICDSGSSGMGAHELGVQSASKSRKGDFTTPTAISDSPDPTRAVQVHAHARSPGPRTRRAGSRRDPDFPIPQLPGVESLLQGLVTHRAALVGAWRRHRLPPARPVPRRREMDRFFRGPSAVRHRTRRLWVRTVDYSRVAVFHVGFTGLS
jgi:hypothetical protein